MAEAVFLTGEPPSVKLSFYQNGSALTRDSFLVPGIGTLTRPSDRNGLIQKRVVLLPSEPVPYSSQEQLLADLIAFVHRYTDLPTFWERMVAHYALMTWAYDRFTAVPYLRFLGEPQTGKTRALQVAGHLSYKGIVGGGATTASPIFRLLDFYRGTLIIDEADYKSSELWSDIIKILNCGYMRGFPVLRAAKSGDSYEPASFDAFGPKILSTRKRFQDHALETRCLTLQMREGPIRRDVPRQLPESFYDEALQLRSKLLQWRFDNHARIQADEAMLLSLEPRLTQIGTPIYSVSTDSEFRADFVRFLTDHSKEERSEQPQAVIVDALSRGLNDREEATLSVKSVAEEATHVSQSWGAEENFSPKRTGGLLRSLGFDPKRTRAGYQFVATATKVAELVERFRSPGE